MGPVWFQRTKWHGADESCCPTSLRMIHGSNRVVFVLEKHCMEPAMCRERLPLFFTFQIINVIKKRHSMWDHSVMYLVKESQSTWPQFLNLDLSASCTAAKQSHRIRTRELTGLKCSASDVLFLWLLQRRNVYRLLSGWTGPSSFITAFCCALTLSQPFQTHGGVKVLKVPIIYQQAHDHEKHWHREEASEKEHRCWFHVVNIFQLQHVWGVAHRGYHSNYFFPSLMEQLCWQSPACLGSGCLRCSSSLFGI